MKKIFHLAVPLVFLLLICSCSDANSYYQKGNPALALAQLERKRDLSSEDYLLKVKCLQELDRDEEALQSIVYYLLTTDNKGKDREYAVDLFLKLNKSYSLSVLLLKPTDGQIAKESLFIGYSKQGELNNASQLLEEIQPILNYEQLIRVLLIANWDAEYICTLFGNWLVSETSYDKDEYLSLLCQFSNNSMSESVAKNTLALTDAIMNDEYYNDNKSRLSLLLKTKGNILDKLYDKVNARLYWNQALKLNPEDLELQLKVK